MRLDGDAWNGLITLPVWWLYTAAVGWGLLLIVALLVTLRVYSRRLRRAAAAPSELPDDDSDTQALPRVAQPVDLFTQAATNARPVEDDPEAPLSHDQWVRWWQANPPSKRWRADPDATPSTRARWIRDWATATQPPSVVVRQMQRDTGLSDGAVKIDTVHDQVDRMREARGDHS